MLFSAFEEPVRAVVLGRPEQATSGAWVNYSVPDEGLLRGSGRRLLTADVPTVLTPSSAIVANDEINVVGDIMFTSATNMKIGNSTEGG